MANRKITLVRRCKTSAGWRYYPVADVGGNGRLKPGAVKVGSTEQHFKEGHYALRSFDGSRIVYEKLGDSPAAALTALRRAETLVEVKELAVGAGAKIVEETGRKNLRAEYKKFLQAAEDRGSMEAAEVYKLACDEFLRVIGKTYVDEIAPEDVTKFHKALRDRGMSKRTVSNRHKSVRAFFIFLKLDSKAMPKPPKYEKTIPEIYEPKDVDALFAAVSNLKDLKEQVKYSVFLLTGLREQEVMHLEWSDISLERKTLQVRGKPKFGFEIKDYEQRELPLADELLELLPRYRLEYPEQSPLLFGKDDLEWNKDPMIPPDASNPSSFS